jgi:hypothetical protein
MTPTPEAIPTSQENPDQPAGWAFVRSLLSSLVHEAIPSAIMGLVYFCLGIMEIFLKACFIFLFVSFCALSILFMWDYIFCNSAHAERFIAIANIVASLMTARGVFIFIALYGIASRFRKGRADLESVAAINVSKTRPHTPD